MAINALANISGVSPSTIYSMLNEKSQNHGVVSLKKLLLKKDGFRNIEFFEMHLNNSIDKNVELLIDMLNL